MGNEVLQFIVFVAFIFSVILFISFLNRPARNNMRKLLDQNEQAVQSQKDIARHLDRIASALEARSK